MALQERADESSHKVGLIHVDIVIAWDFHILEPLEKGAGGEMLLTQETSTAACLQGGQRQPLFPAAWGLEGCSRT